MDWSSLRRATTLLVAGVVLILTASVSHAAADPPNGPPPAAAPGDDTPVPIPEPSAKAVRYHETGLWLWAFARVWDVAVPAAILLTGFSARLRDLAKRVGRNWYGTVAVYLASYIVLTFLADLPLRYYAGYVRQHAYGLSNQTLTKWATDAVLGAGVDVVGVVLFGWVPFFVLARYPRRWWLILSGLMVPFVAFVVLVSPVLIDPLFNDFGPMKNRDLERQILDLARRAGVDGGRVFEVNKSVDTKAVNAYVKGLFGTHRIVLWDTLTGGDAPPDRRRFSDAEIVAIMGHEIGHYVLRHVEWGVVLSSVLLVAGLFWTDRSARRLVARYGPRWGIESLADVAATPLLLTMVALSSVVLGPVALVYSRYEEHEADRFSLELTQRNRPAARAFAEFTRSNLSVPEYDTVERIWRATHPSLAERITFSNTYRPWATGQPLWYGHLFRP